MKIPFTNRAIVRQDQSNPYGGIGIGVKRQDSFVKPYTLSNRNASPYGMISPMQLFFIATHDPVAYRITFKSCEDAINPWFTILDQDDKVHEKNKKVQEKLQKMKAKEVVKSVSTYNEIFGRSWVTRKDDIWHPISPLDLNDPSADVFNEKGENQPIKVIYRFQHSGPSPQPIDVNPSDYIFFRSRPRGLTSLGISIIEVCYDDLHYLYNIRRDMAERIRKYAGFPHIKITDANDSLIQAYKSEYGDVNKLDELWSNDRLELIMKGLEGTALNPDVYYKPFMEQISIATGIPSPILQGSESGQLKSGQINLSSYYSVVSNIQIGATPLVESLIDWVEPDLMKKAKIRWNIEYALSDIDREAMNEIRVANAVSLKSYITDEAFARLLADLGITKKDIKSQEEIQQSNPLFQQKFPPEDGEKPNSPFEGRMNPISEEKGRDFGDQKNPQVQSETK